MGGQELHRFRCPQKYLAFDAKERLNTIPVPQAYRLCRAKSERACRCLGTECQGEQPREEQRFPQSRLQSNKRWLGFSCFSPFYPHRYAPIINSLWVYFQACRRQVSRRLSRTREVRAEWRHVGFCRGANPQSQNGPETRFRGEPFPYSLNNEKGRERSTP